MFEVQRVLNVANELGEGPLWNADDQALYWVDINVGRFHRYFPADGRVESFSVGLPVGVVRLRRSGGLVMGTRDGLAFWHPQTQSVEFIADPEAGKPNARFNDGVIDRQGRFWAGTIAPGMTSALYRLDPDRSVHTMETEVGVSNGIGWSLDDRTMYYTDSPRRTIYAYDFDAATGAIAHRRPFVQLGGDEPGFPDGLAVDGEGFIWSARWDGWKIARYDPAGKLEREIQMPVQRPTSCAFGGANLDELYITSAWTGLSDEQRRAQPYAGDVFRVQAGIKGLPEGKFAG
jgi:sugar lactone lactonase YvrE